MFAVCLGAAQSAVFQGWGHCICTVPVSGTCAKARS